MQDPPHCRPGRSLSPLPAEHEGPVSSVRVSPGGLRVLSTTSSGHLGFLDVPSQEYRLLVRSHTAPVLALATERSRGQLATVSQDRTVRVWDLATLQQVGCGQRAPAGRAVWRLQDTLRPGGRALGPPARVWGRGSSPLGRVALGSLPSALTAHPPNSCMTSRRPRRLRVLSPSTPLNRPSSAASAAGLSAPSAWRPLRSWWNTGGRPGRPAPQLPAVDARPLLPLDTLWASVHLSVWRRCHRGAITGLAASPDGRFLFSACSRGALAQYHSGAPRCRVLRVAGQAPTPGSAWASQYLPDRGPVSHSLTHRPTGPDVVSGLPSSPQVGDQSAPALRQDGVIACSPSTRGQGRAPWTPCLASQGVSGWSLGEPRRSGSACCRGVHPAQLTACPLVLAANVVCQEACPSSSILAVSEDSRLLAFVGPSKYTVSVVDTASLDEVS